MKPVDQTKFGYPGGNCYAAALASILEIALIDIPEFGVDDGWYDKFSRYMVSHHALQPLDLDVKSLPEWATPRGFHLINGKSPRINARHTVVGFNGEPIHDPYPGGSCELVSIQSYTVFIVLDPKQVCESKSLKSSG